MLFSGRSFDPMRWGCAMGVIWASCRNSWGGTKHTFSADRRSELSQPVYPSDHRCPSAASGHTRAVPRCARVARHLLRGGVVDVRVRTTFHTLLRYEGPCLTRAEEPPRDQFGTLALRAHSQRESPRLGGPHRPAPGFPDHWAGSRTETI
jgi:hypothetical protein